MRASSVAVFAVLLLAILPVPTAQAAGWSVEATLAVTSATTADYTWAIGLSTPTRLRLPLPDDSTFVEARDVDGKRLDALVEGDDVVVTSGNKPFTIRFSLQGARDGPFSTFPAQVASASDSPVKIHITLPTGWSLAGYRDSDGRTPDLTGAFTGDGPAYVQYLALAPGYVDAGPVPGIVGHQVKREGVADITGTSAKWTLETTYDTDVYSRSWEVHVPPGASVTDATSPFGPLTTSRAGDTLHVTTPYPVGFGLGARSFTVNMTLPPPAAHGGTFREVNLSVRAAEGDDVHIRARLAGDLRYTGARVAGGAEVGELNYIGTGPLTIGLAFLPPAAPDHVQLVEGRFVVDTPRALETAARASAKSAHEHLPTVASFAFDARDTRPFFVAYTDAPVFGWEEGFYSNGLNTITIRASTLDGASDGKAHLLPVGVLVHEATHGLIDRRMPDAPHNLSFLHEGLSRLAETRLERAFPANEVVVCDGMTCARHSARPAPDALQSYHRTSGLFDVSWRASDAAESQRSFLYDYSGLVLHAFDARSPPGALAHALAHINATTFSGDSNADAQKVLDIFLAHTPGTSAPAFLYPGREVAGLVGEQFRFCLGELVAPPYPWDDARAPPGGCPSTGYGSRGATLPAPPASFSPPPSPATQPTPTPAVTSAPRPVPPTTVTPSPPASNDGFGEQPGAVVRDPASEGSGGDVNIVNVDVPAAGIAVAILAIALVALTTRRRA